MVGAAEATPRFTVFLPTHGRADVIGASIQSILDQTVQDFELLIVGDGCEDDTAAVVSGFEDPRLRWMPFPKAPGSGYANRNRALTEARGEIIALAQHDDLMLHDHLRLLGECFWRPATQWAYSRPAWIDDAGLILPYFVNLTVAAHRQRFMTVTNAVPTNCIAFRRSALERTGPFDESLPRANDWEMWKRFVTVFGPGCIGFQRRTTSLHFRAAWKPTDTWGPPPLGHLEAMARSSGAWPRVLNLTLPSDGVPPQIHVARMMQEHPAQFAAQLRYGIDRVQDMMAWSVSHNPIRAGL